MADLIDHFEHISVVYKTMNNVDITAEVLVPKALSEKSCPLLVHFHGGGLMMGRPLEPLFLADWLVKLAEMRGAVLVSPAYRLMPETSCAEIMDDIRDFWTWTSQTLPAVLAEQAGVRVDLDKVAVSGESAGGFLAVQSALFFPQAAIRIVMAQYCAMHTDIEVCQGGPGQAVLREVETYLEKQAPGVVRTMTPFPDMIDLAVRVMRSGMKEKVMGSDERLTLSRGLETAATIPPLWVMQGSEDHMMPPEATDTMVARIREARPEVPLLYSVQPGGHGFDVKAKMSEPWIVEAMAFIGRYWP